MTSCDSTTSCGATRTEGTCQVERKDPLIHSTEAEGADSGKSIPELISTGITLDESDVRGSRLSRTT
jgi:hypothetical protein